jgi:hypothetical protein
MKLMTTLFAAVLAVAAFAQTPAPKADTKKPAACSGDCKACEKGKPAADAKKCTGECKDKKACKDCKDGAKKSAPAPKK